MAAARRAREPGRAGKHCQQSPLTLLIAGLACTGYPGVLLSLAVAGVLQLVLLGGQRHIHDCRAAQGRVGLQGRVIVCSEDPARCGPHCFPLRADTSP